MAVHSDSHEGVAAQAVTIHFNLFIYYVLSYFNSICFILFYFIYTFEIAVHSDSHEGVAARAVK
jgi:hypothetical protein